MKSVHSAVRTGALNKAVCASSVKTTGHVMHQQFNIQQLYVLPTHSFSLRLLCLTTGWSNGLLFLTLATEVWIYTLFNDLVIILIVTIIIIVFVLFIVNIFIII